MTHIKNVQEVDQFVAPIGTTLDRFITQRQQEFPYAKGELSQLLRDIGLAAKIVNLAIVKSGLSGIEGLYGEQNVHGEDQQKMDVVANVRFIRALTRGEEVCAIVSEEEDGIVDTGHCDAKYIVAMDPLDGSSNIDVNTPIGTIFAIYRRKSEVGTPPTEEDVMQKGQNQVAAGYVMYGASTMLVYTTGHGVNGFTYEYSLGEFILSHPNIKTKPSGNYYACNEGYWNDYSQGVKDYLNYCHDQHYKTRYSGSMVADFHRILLKGGIFMYPSTKKDAQGKLRLLYECNPLSFVMEQAGGKAHNGIQRILEIEPKSLHQRAPLVMGSADMVDKLAEMVQKYAK
ncbi:MAG: class 1 fructose-bisphosphatase [Bacteroidetes bacterium]|nr:MAG: class 1 fructose-bisphosphatase [Bacteroidota bacterium]